MTAFAAGSVGPLTLDPDKRVHYALGLVLGVDEFQQEQFYHMAGRRGHNRLLHGYGTVSGLAVTPPEPGAADPEIQVSPGVAVDPCGREICVPDTMCVRLSGWLDRHRSVLEDLYPGGVGELPLAVVLCYRECATDVVPIPGEPCRTQEDAMQPSRLQDSFELRLALREDGLFGSPPMEPETGLHLYRADHAEEAAVRAFGDLLASVEIGGGGAGAGVADLLAAVRALADLEPDLPSPPTGSPPATTGVAEAHATEAFREAFRVWATEVRPAIRAREPGGSACGPGDEECCVLLAEVDLPVTADWAVAGVAFEPREVDRPILLHTRLLQEWLGRTGGPAGSEYSFATIEALTPNRVRAWLHYPMPLALEVDDLLAEVGGGAAEPPAGLATVSAADNVFDVQLATSLSAGDTVELRFDLTTITVVDSPVGSVDEALSGQRGLLDRFGPEVRAYAVFRPAGAELPDYEQDLEGSHPAATVVGLRGNPLAATAPDTGDVLTWDGSEWTPASAPPPPAPELPSATGDVAGTYPELDVVGLRGRPVAAAAPSAGQVLTWTSAGQWRPQTPAGQSDRVVAAPEPGLSIVAAGSFDGAGNPQGPTFGGLRAERLQRPPGHYNLAFDGYQLPEDRGFAFVVKGMAINSEGAGPPFVVEFVRFFREHFRIRVMEPQGEASATGFMIEVTMIRRG